MSELFMAPLAPKQEFTQMSQDSSKTIAESQIIPVRIGNTVQRHGRCRTGGNSSDGGWLQDQQGAPCKEVESTKTTSFEEAVTKLTDSTGAPRMHSNKGKFEVVNSLKQELKEEEMGSSTIVIWPW